MNRNLLALVIVEGVVIAVLVVLLALDTSATPPAEAAERSTSESTEGDPVPARARLAAEEPEADPGPSISHPRRTTPEPAHDPSLGTLLYGQVLDPSGQPLESARVYVRRAGDRRSTTGTYTGGRGYAIPGLDPGTWAVRCTADGYRPFYRELEVRAAEHQRFDIEVSKARILRVAFVDENGDPAAERWREAGLPGSWRIGVVATTDEPPEAFPMTTLRSVSRLGVGQWRSRRWNDGELAERFAGILEIHADGPVWVSAVLRQEVVGKARVLPDPSELDLVIPTSTLTGRLATVRARIIASESSIPLEGAGLSISDRQSSGQSQKTDADGRIVVENTIPGIVEVNVGAEGREQYHRMLRLEAGADVDLGDVPLDPAHEVEGTVYGPGGEPLGGVSFDWFRIGRYGPTVPLDHAFSAHSDAEGKFGLFGCGAGRYLLEARHDQGVATTVFDTSAGDVTDLEVHLSEGVEVTLVNRVEPSATYLVSLVDASGLVVRSWLERPLPTLPERPTTIPPGRYQVQIRKDRELVRTFTLDARTSGRRIVIP